MRGAELSGVCRHLTRRMLSGLLLSRYAAVVLHRSLTRSRRSLHGVLSMLPTTSRCAAPA